MKKFSGLDRNNLISLKKDFEDNIKSINSELSNLDWIECQNNVKNLPSKIDKNNIHQILYTRCLADRFMVFDVSKEMRMLEEKLTGNIKKGYSLSLIKEAFTFYSNNY